MTNILHENNLKQTKNREVILNIIKGSVLPMSAEDIYKHCLDQKININLSTIYRTLNTMENKHLLIKQVRNDGKAYFQENKHDHKHLFVCTSCGKNIILDNCPLEEMLQTLSAKSDFTIQSHNIELYGICKKCGQKQR